MTDFNFRKPTTGEQVLKAAPDGTKLWLYSELASDPRPPHQVLASMVRDNIILIQNPNKMNSGHWIALSFHPETREIYYFSSYGGRPDEEKLIWIPSDGLLRSKQVRNVINDGLKYFAKRGWVVDFNDVGYQHIGDGSATCGVWAAAFLRSGVNPDVFAKRHLKAEDYFRRYFY